jgi:Ca2+-transporting ATPase
MSEWYKRSIEQVLKDVETDESQGLSEAEARRRLEQYGENVLAEQEGRSPWRILWDQLSGVMVMILFVAAVISIFLGDVYDAVVILAIIILNAALGFQQEYKAERSMAALKKLAVPIVKVKRDGAVRELPSGELVPGDIVLLETGNLVPADGRVLASVNMRVEEAALTGESVPIDKEAELVFESDRALGDRRNVVYMGTVVNYGRGEVVITETGMQTELGHIAKLIQSVEVEATPLQQRLDRVGKVLAVVALVIVGVIFLLGLLRGEDLEEMFLTAVSLAVAAVPEAMPAVATIALALGAQRMLARNALIRKLPAVETLGSVNVICSDKTGTLTKNQMAVTVLDIANNRLDLVQKEASTELEIVPVEGELSAPGAQSTIDLLLVASALCNDAILQVQAQENGQFRTVGDPTETALVMAAAKMGILKSDLDKAFPRIGEVPFDSGRKRMTTLHRTSQSAEDIPSSLMPLWERRLADQPPPYLACTKGAIDGLLRQSKSVFVEGQLEELTAEWEERILTAHDRMAQNGMRILAVGVRLLESPPAKYDEETLERDLILVGLVGMIDPPRPEVKSAVDKCRSAGIRTVMITGDHPLTARHIAEQLGISDDGNYIIGQELDRMGLEEMTQAALNVNVFARVSPEHKIRLVQVFQEQGYIVAMTGDGVNDAPALKKADIGVAMGITGTDVSKEASDMVLQDDNFATIVNAVEEGRVIYDNIRKFIRYLLSCNSAEIAVMLFGPLLGMPLPLLPLQILWMNLVTDGLPALALGMEPAEPGVMKRPPNPASVNIFDRRMVLGILWLGVLMAIISLGVGYFYWQAGIEYWQTMTFTTLTLSQMAAALAARSENTSLWKIGIFSNQQMLRAILTTFVLQLAVIYLPFMQNILNTDSLPVADLAIALGVSLLVLLIAEVVKWIERRQRDIKRSSAA